MTESLRVLICDDQLSRRTEWLEALQEVPGLAHRLEPIEFGVEDFKRDFIGLKRRRTATRPATGGADTDSPVSELGDDPSDAEGADSETIFDAADVLIVDYALEEFEEDEDYLTGALIAYLARCYSSCGVIVGVNQHGENPFDLTFVGDRSSFADVDIGQAQIANPGLWDRFDDVAARYRPWSWPLVPDLVRRFPARVEFVLERLDEPVLSALGLDRLAHLTPRTALQAIEVEHKAAEAVTFQDVAREPKLGLRRGEHPMSEIAIARIAAARVSKWLETAVFPLQEVVIDAPHLVARNARLLAGPPGETASWQAVCKVGIDHREAGIIEEVHEHRYPHDLWTSRPTWFWPDVIGDDALPGVADPWDIPPTSLVFCEDLSRFLDRAHARRVVMDVGNNTTRWVADPTKLGEEESIQEVDYQPQRRLAI